MHRGHPEDRTRLSWWFPKLPHYIPTPETLIIPYDGYDLINLLDGETPADLLRLVNFGVKILCSRIVSAGNVLGWPLFLRTDYLSGKHHWKDTCHVPGPECVAKRVAHLVEESAIADIMGFPTDYWIARELISTKPVFHAFYGEMPIVKERRYFVQDDQVMCHHPYWPADAFLHCSVPNWEELLIEMNIEDVAEVDLLSKLSSKVGAALGGAWSIDWLWSEKECQWYLTDMADAVQSYHWPGCPKKEAR